MRKTKFKMTSDQECGKCFGKGVVVNHYFDGSDGLRLSLRICECVRAHMVGSPLPTFIKIAKVERKTA